MLRVLSYLVFLNDIHIEMYARKSIKFSKLYLTIYFEVCLS